MSKIIVNVCDLCGCNQNEKDNTHWSNRITKIILTVGQCGNVHPGMQGIIFEGDVCGECAQKLGQTMKKAIRDLKDQRHD